MLDWSMELLEYPWRCCQGRISTSEVLVPVVPLCQPEANSLIAPWSLSDKEQPLKQEDVDLGLRKGRSSSSAEVGPMSSSGSSIDTSLVNDSMGKSVSTEIGLPRVLSADTPCVAVGEEDVQQSPHAESIKKASSSRRDLMRRVPTAAAISKRLTARFSRLRRQTTLFTASKRVPAAAEPTWSQLSSHHIPDATVTTIYNALRNLENCPLCQFRREVAGCHGFEGTSWQQCPDMEGTEVRKVCYTTEVPPDIPSIARKLLNIPDEIRGSTVSRLRREEEKVVLVEHSYTRDILYGDRFKVEFTLSVLPDIEKGGVTIRQWVEILWDKPLPWTHGVLKHMIESRAKSDAALLAVSWRAFYRPPRRLRRRLLYPPCSCSGDQMEIREELVCDRIR